MQCPVNVRSMSTMTWVSVLVSSSRVLQLSIDID